MPENAVTRQNPCPIWVWLILLIGLVMLYLLYNHAIAKKALWIQQDIQNRASQSMHNNGQLMDVTVTADGRDITLSGNVSSELALAEAENLARQIVGARLINNQLVVSDAPTATPSEAEANQIATTAEPEITAPKPSEILAKVEPMPQEFAPLNETELAQQEKQPLTETQIELTEAEITKQKLSQLDFSNITFEKNSTALTADAQSTLDQVVSALSENPTVNIHVNGHTDSSGNPELNLKLSKQRAQSVFDYLVNAGIDGIRIQANGFGDQFPIAPNDTKAGRIKNRRIEIKVKNGE